MPPLKVFDAKPQILERKKPSIHGNTDPLCLLARWIKPREQARARGGCDGDGDDGQGPLTSCRTLPHLGVACASLDPDLYLRSLMNHLHDDGDGDDAFFCHHLPCPDPCHHHLRRGDVSLYT